MSNIKHLVELEDGFIGDEKEVAEHLGVSYSCVNNAVLIPRKKIAGKYDFKDLGMYYKRTIYQVSDETGILFEGDKLEIAKRMYYSIGWVEKGIMNGRIGKYFIKKSGEEYRKEPMRL